ncbi:sperm-associated antigen 6-like [Diorhabda carinulata]|uniref:sperm-associated antigen 6-like n=1 Tax=Diorhabda sublineata TaxID=1163346 RepID=UPI0024E093AD|nr:sperm-associated antigen 6-like [Diorhabda sublineata]XP_057658588.1 sperm-associated antigen 6-like [Diorhabda carinulata]
MSNRNLVLIFEQYQRARLGFVQAVSDLAVRQQNIELLAKGGALELLKPLLSDPCIQIQQCASIALGRLVHHDVAIAEQVIDQGFIPIILTSIFNGNKYQKKAGLFVIRSICKNNVNCAYQVINAGGLQALIGCLEDFESSVKEAAAWGIGYIARHSKSLAQTCVESGAVPLLLLCLQEPEISLKQITTSALADIAKHGLELAQSVVDAGAIPYFVKNLSNTDEKLKKQILAALSSCAKHSLDIAEAVVEAEIFPTVLLHLAHPCPGVRRNAACLVRDIVKQSLELTQLVVNTGGIGALMEVLYQNDSGGAKMPTIVALGFISAHSEHLAMSVLGCKVIVILAEILETSTDDSLLAATTWTIGQIGKHSADHSQAVAAANIFPRLVALHESDKSSDDLKYKCKNTLKLCLQKCLLVDALEPLLYSAPSQILKYVLGQYSKLLPQDPKARRLFVTTGGLKKVQLLDAKPGTTLFEYITVINSCFPEEIVRYYSPGYPESLLDKVEQYSPQMMTVLRENNQNENEAQTDMLHMVDQNSTDEEDDMKNFPE